MLLPRESQHQCWQQNALHTARRRRRSSSSSSHKLKLKHSQSTTSATSIHCFQGTHYLPALLIALLVLLQNIELHMCRQLTPHDKQQLLMLRDMPQDNSIEERRMRISGSAAGDLVEIDQDKRAVVHSQPEEIFNAPRAGDMDMSYDEYPMIVPKRAALLLDRLMVALHHALEHERKSQRISDFYGNKNILNLKPNDYNNELEMQQVEDGSNSNSNSYNNNMYSDDDPGVITDYDFKDLSQINLATGGETLMPKSFQRRANLIDGGGVGATEGVALLANTAALEGASSLSNTGNRRLNMGSGGRMYWRCYFNAVSCF